jgi:hypothetical protein
MPRYRLRFFFDPRGEPCLWAGNEAALLAYGYPVETEKLPLSENVHRRLNYLCAWYATSIDWDYPSGPSPWDEQERARFAAEVSRFLPVLRAELGPDYEIVDETGKLIGEC